MLLTYMISVGPSSVFKIVKMIMERNFQPVIIFSFSKKECEAYALQVAKLDFNRGMCICCSNFLFLFFLSDMFLVISGYIRMTNTDYCHLVVGRVITSHRLISGTECIN